MPWIDATLGRIDHRFPVAPLAHVVYLHLAEKGTEFRRILGGSGFRCIRHPDALLNALCFTLDLPVNGGTHGCHEPFRDFRFWNLFVVPKPLIHSDFLGAMPALRTFRV